MDIKFFKRIIEKEHNNDLMIDNIQYYLAKNVVIDDSTIKDVSFISYKMFENNLD